MKINEEVKKFLKSNEDTKYLEFSSGLGIYGKYNKIGVRLPIITKYAKELSKKYELDYLYKNIDEEYYEEVLLKGLLIGNYKKLSFEELEKYIDDYVPKIDDWSICDSFCNGLKITKKYLDKMFILINRYLKYKSEFKVRFALVMLLKYYVNDEYLDKVLEIISNVTLDKYYVKMANAWLMSWCLIYYYDESYIFLKNNRTIDKWTYNKGIQKSIESFRLTDEQKDELRKLKKI